MSPSRFEQIAAICQAVQHLGLAERNAYLADACGDDDELRRDVEVLLAKTSGPSLGEVQPHLPPASESTLADATVTMIRVGSQLGPYRIEAPLGAGGMGQVFRGVDTRLGRKVAIKISNEKFSERFEREAVAISALNHPHICTLYDVGPNYLVMELVDGSTLAEEIRKASLDLASVLNLASQVAEALAEAHAHGIVHRDLKPRNIMVSRHGVKVLDFGLAKMYSQGDLTESNVVMGTPAYMAPEQIQGRDADARTDLFALGLVIYEMVAGKLPVPGASYGQLLAAGSSVPLPGLSSTSDGVPESLRTLVSKLLAKDPNQRPASAAEVAQELSAIVRSLAAPSEITGGARISRTYLAAGIATLLALLAVGGVLFRRLEHQRWAREDAMPEIKRLLDEKKALAAFLVLQEAQQYLPSDAQLKEMEKNLTLVAAVSSIPPGATIEIQDYSTPQGNWLALGTTNLASVQIPKGPLRWRVSTQGLPPLLAAPVTQANIQFDLQSSAAAPEGMVHVPQGAWGDLIDFIGWVGFQLPAYDIDKFEVTNRQFQEFVDKNGYRTPEFWKQKFVKDGKELSWQEATDLFRDSSGRPGPSTWEAGHFPTGQADYPVAGVSWYEAAAYAAFAGKNLPAFGQWFKAAPPEWGIAGALTSNFGGKGPAAVGTFAGVGPYGTHDMAGNVREWCWNADEQSRRFILGGAWRTQPYQAFEPETLSSFDRSPLNGIRLVRNASPLPDSILGPILTTGRDFSQAKPVSDDVFQAYKSMYAYDRRPLNAKSESASEETPDWTKHRITIDAGYENERLPLYLFLPKNVHPPFQAVVFFPSARVNFMPDSKNLGDLPFVDYVIKSGRAVVYPIFNGTYERTGRNRPLPGAVEDLQFVTREFKEVARAVDYLETLPQIDRTKLAYLGVSQGSAYGVIFATLEDRFKAVVFLDGGFFLNPALPARDQVNFAPRLKKPVLMVNGEYDHSFSPDRAQLPLFKMIGTPESDKRRVLSATAHDVSQDMALLSKEVLVWLDKYLGRIN